MIAAPAERRSVSIWMGKEMLSFALMQTSLRSMQFTSPVHTSCVKVIKRAPHSLEAICNLCRSITLKTYANFCDSSLYLHHYSTSLPSSLPLWPLPPHSPPPPRSPDPPPSANTSELEVWQILVTQMPRMMRIHASPSLLLLLSRNT